MRKRKEHDPNKVVRVSTTINYTLWRQAIDKVSWNECLIYGITAKLAEKGIKIYQNPLQNARKVAQIMRLFNDLNEKMLKMEKSISQKEGEIEVKSDNLGAV